MKISTRGRYGIRLLIDLAEHVQTPGPITLAKIAERQGISVRYLEQVAIILRRTGFIRSMKGATGGYILARAPESIIVGDTLRALEGDMLIIDPPDPLKPEGKLRQCVRRCVFEPLNRRIADIIDRETLADLAGTYDPEASYMYFI